MGKDVVITPLFKRPEYLKVWIEVLKKVDCAEEHFYIFCEDYGYDQTHDFILKSFPFEFGVVKTPRTNYRLTKQSYNVLNGLMVGAKHSDNLVYYIEEDIFLAKDFFRFHREVQKEDLFCSIGTKNNNSQFDVTDNQDYYYLSDRGDYQSLGSCFNREILLKQVAPHFTNDYFKNPVEYCTRHFPLSSIGKFFVEQDGLIRRILEKSKMFTAFPHVPRGFHGGIYGYNRRDDSINKLKFEEKVNKIKEVAFSKTNLKNYVKHPEYYTDSEPCRLDTDFKELTKVNVDVK